MVINIVIRPLQPFHGRVVMYGGSIGSPSLPR
jgi:hypothetical protein